MDALVVIQALLNAGEILQRYGTRKLAVSAGKDLLSYRPKSGRTGAGFKAPPPSLR